MHALLYPSLNIKIESCHGTCHAHHHTLCLSYTSYSVFRLSHAGTHARTHTPGYGFEQEHSVLSKKWKGVWGPLVKTYLGNTPSLRAALFLADVRWLPLQEDRSLSLSNFLATRPANAWEVAVGTNGHQTSEFIKKSESSRNSPGVGTERPPLAGCHFRVFCRKVTQGVPFRQPGTRCVTFRQPGTRCVTFRQNTRKSRAAALAPPPPVARCASPGIVRVGGI
jgi:hypothetical protein